MKEGIYKTNGNKVEYKHRLNEIFSPFYVFL